MISFKDWQKLEIKIGTIISVEKVPDTNKLLKFMIDFGNEKRQIIAGMNEFFPNPSILVSKQVPVLLNLEPAVFKGQKSEGMILAGDVNERAILLHPEKKVPAGSKVR